MKKNQIFQIDIFADEIFIIRYTDIGRLNPIKIKISGLYDNKRIKVIDWIVNNNFLKIKSDFFCDSFKRL